jgi:hypothetical protein
MARPKPVAPVSPYATPEPEVTPSGDIGHEAPPSSSDPFA